MVTRASQKFPGISEKPIISKKRGLTEQHINFRRRHDAQNFSPLFSPRAGLRSLITPPRMTTSRFRGAHLTGILGKRENPPTSSPAIQRWLQPTSGNLPANTRGSAGGFPETSRGPWEDNHRTVMSRVFTRFGQNMALKGGPREVSRRLPPDSEKFPRKLPPLRIPLPNQVLSHQRCAKKIP